MMRCQYCIIMYFVNNVSKYNTKGHCHGITILFLKLSRRNIYTCICFAQVNFARLFNNRLNTLVLSINMNFYYRSIIFIQGLKGSFAGTMILCYLYDHAINCTFPFNNTSSSDYNKVYNKNTENTITYECNNNDFFTDINPDLNYNKPY